MTNEWQHDSELIRRYQCTSCIDTKRYIETYYLRRYEPLKAKLARQYFIGRQFDSYFFFALRHALMHFDTNAYTNFYTYFLLVSKKAVGDYNREERMHGHTLAKRKDLDGKWRLTEAEQRHLRQYMLNNATALPENYEQYLPPSPGPDWRKEETRVNDYVDQIESRLGEMLKSRGQSREAQNIAKTRFALSVIDEIKAKDLLEPDVVDFYASKLRKL